MHLFLQSDWAIPLWSHFEAIFEFQSELYRTSVLSCYLSWSLPGNSLCRVDFIRRLIPILVVCELWKSRNASKFEGKPLNIHAAIWKINRSIKELLSIKKFEEDRPSDLSILQNFQLSLAPVKERRPTLVSWLLPPSGRFKLNADGASRGNPGTSGGAGVLRDATGNLLLAYAFPYGFCTGFEAEFRAVLDGLRTCRELELIVDIVEVDSLSLASLLQGRSSIPWKLWNLWSELQDHLSFYKPIIAHTYREGNQLADSLANFACEADAAAFFFHQSELPGRARGVFVLDKSQFPSIRLV